MDPNIVHTDSADAQADPSLYWVQMSFYWFCSFKQEKGEDSGVHKRTIHKTTSADAAMMASEVLPVDPSDLGLGLVRSKPKTSL